MAKTRITTSKKQATKEDKLRRLSTLSIEE